MKMDGINGTSAQIFNIKLHDDDPKLVPKKSNPTDAGFDLVARCWCVMFGGRLSEDNPFIDGEVWIGRGEIVLIKTGVYLELNEGWEAQIRCRSGLALKQGLTIVNSPGTIDAGYRNEIGVILQNVGQERIVIRKYDRIAQMVIKEVPEVMLVVVDEINDTARGLNGFGSSGKN